MNTFTKLTLATATIASLAACTPQEVAWWAQHPDTPVPAEMRVVRPCEADAQGRVWITSTDPIDCDVYPPQTLWTTDFRSFEECVIVVDDGCQLDY